MEALQQSVVKFARDAGALSDPRLQRQFELALQSPHPPLVDHPQNHQQKSGGENSKPVGSPPRGRDDDRQRCSFLVPHAIAIRCLNAEEIPAWIQVGVGSDTLTTAYLVPSLIKVFELVSITVLLRVGVAQRREFKREDVI